MILPRPLLPIRPSYPDGASGDAVVKLEVVVGTLGLAQSIKVVEGVPPFSTAAMAAAAAARFEPAKKGDEVIAARFVLEVRFSAPLVTPPHAGASDKGPGESNPQATPGKNTISPPSVEIRPPSVEQTPRKEPSPGPPGASDPPAAPPTPIDVTVEGARGLAPAPEPAGEHLSAKMVSRIPGAFGDAFRAIEILPGIVPYASGLPYFFVRGATPTTTGYFLDGVPVPLLFHVGVGPGVIAPQILGALDFYPGGYPVTLGRQIGGVLSAQSAEAPPRFSGEVTLRALDAGAFVTAPLPSGKGSAFAAGRFSLTQAILPLITPDVSLGYWDYQAGAMLRISSREKLRLLAFGADDFLTQTEGQEVNTLYSGQFHRVDLAYERGGPSRSRPLAGSVYAGSAPDEAPEELRVRLAVTGGTDRTSINGQGDLLSTMGQVRALFDAKLHRYLRLRAGADFLAESRRLARSALDQAAPDDDGSFAEAFSARTVGTFGGFAELSSRPWSFLELTLGLRADYFGDPAGAGAGVDPRGSVRLALFPWLTSVTVAGVVHQRPSFLVPLPGAVPVADELVLQRALHASQSFELTLPWRVGFRATGYVHEYADLTDFLATCGPGRTECPLTDRAGGLSYGLELLLSRELSEKLGGQIAYTFSRTERTFDDSTFAADIDRTHVVHAVIGYEPAPGWHAGVRLTAYSGRPFSLVAHDSRADPERETLVGKRNVPRGPGFFRLDARVSKTWRFGERGFVTAVLEGLNVTLQKETIVIDCRTPIEAGQSCGPQEFGPISIPSIGLQGGY